MSTVLAGAPAKIALRIEPVAVKDLHAFVCAFLDNPEGQEIAPLTRHRALAQAKNPYADPDDIALLVAYNGAQCVGYQGILPGRLRTPAGTSKVLWCTANYVLPEFRNRMLGILFLRKLMSFKQDVAATGFEHAGAHMLKGLHFRELGPLTYLKVVLQRLDFPGGLFCRGDRLRRRWPLWRRISGSAAAQSAAVFYPPVRSFYYRLLSRRAAARLRSVRYREVSSVTPFAGLPGETSARFERGADLVNWMMEFPWIQEGGRATTPPYYFSDMRNLSRYIAVEFETEHKDSPGSAVFYVSESHGRRSIRLTDCHCPDADREKVLWLSASYAARYQADEWHLPIGFQSVAAALPLAPLVVQTAQRAYYYHPGAQGALAGAANDIALDLSDGDCSFC